MNKDKAKQELRHGAVLTHHTFTFDEFVYQDGENVFDENGNKMPDGVRSERIRCPKCSKEQVGIVQLTKPFNTYIHYCGYCNYCITESEWNKI